MVADVINLTSRAPVLATETLLASLVPPPQFHGASFDNYVADPAYPSQLAAKERLLQFCAPDAAKRRFFGRSRAKSAATSGVYLDGGFGVGKTHLLAAAFYAFPSDKKLFASFIELTALVGVLGFANTISALSDYRLLCIDEFELDDPGDTMVMNRLLGKLAEGGTKIIATSNTPANALGEGRFAASDFLREIQALSAIFEALRIDGVDYRHRDMTQGAAVLDAERFPQIIELLPGTETVSIDSFTDLLEHLSSVHPSRYAALFAGVDRLFLTDVAEIEDQAKALRFVAFVDRLYDAQMPVSASGLPLDQVFPDWMLAGGYRKKYLRAISRLVALSQLASASEHPET